MEHQTEKQQLADKLNAMPPMIAEKAINAIGGFASGFLSGYEAAKREQENEKKD